ncbi:hypothetical protein KIH27_21410 [Mycobacterium sp. M1]|uniref:Oligoendopeptidase F n=1 Tax=Mycolicibacter acidiphilus TaxID=2835306 RepID=A0ABS5RPC6_9MYCO|nr:type VII secretion target [Mycolicibacter acidiphilus]MBS9536146.1 hypothetical protein [Mycolicibacter acidiphilus]
MTPQTISWDAVPANASAADYEAAATELETLANTPPVSIDELRTTLGKAYSVYLEAEQRTQEARKAALLRLAASYRQLAQGTKAATQTFEAGEDEGRRKVEGILT